LVPDDGFYFTTTGGTCNSRRKEGRGRVMRLFLFVVHVFMGFTSYLAKEGNG